MRPTPEILIDNIGGNCPVQADGVIDGEPFYFRARGEHWAIEIGPGNTHLVVAAMERHDAERWRVEALPCWRYEENYPGERFAAGWITEDEARAFIAKGADLWRAHPTEKTR